jgi:hypothetical protein
MTRCETLIFEIVIEELQILSNRQQKSRGFYRRLAISFSDKPVWSLSGEGAAHY